MKAHGLLARNWLRASDGEAIHSALCGAGHNRRLILGHLRVLLLAFIAMIMLGRIGRTSSRRTLNAAAQRVARVIHKH